MKKIKLLMFLLVMLVATGHDCLAQIYCASPRTSANPTTQTLNLTCRNVSGTTYEMKLEFANAVTSIANANIGANPGPVNVAASPVWSNGNKTLTYTFTASSTPTLYVATIFVMIGGTEVRWDLPTNANFATTCVTAPVLTTTAATAVGNNVGTMNGNISSNGGSNITSYGFYWSTTNGFANGAGTQVEKGTSNYTGNISHELTSLSEGITYYYKAYATNSSGTTYGTQQSFTTISQNPPPTVTSPTVTAITATSATLGANITNTGGTPITARGTSYKTTSPVAATDNQLAEGSTGSGVFTQSRTTFAPQTQYYYVGYATNDNGTSISSEGNFRTLSNPATAQPTSFTTTAAINSLVVNWNAATFPASGATRAGYLVIYSTGTPSLTSANGAAPAASGTIVNVGNTTLPTTPALTTTITSLTGGTTYNLLIVPYTWDGTNASTYNYLTSGAMTATGTPTAMPAAPTPPARNSADVLRVFTDSYATSAAISGPNWTNASDVSVSGNAAKLSTNVSFAQVAFGSTTAASGMTYIHVDVFTTTSNASQMKVQVNGVSTAYNTPNGQWTSLDIPATAYTGGFSTVSLVNLQPNAGAATFYFDNIYFYKPAAALINPTITNFPNISKNLGDPAFTLTQPTSDSPGTFSYGSSNTSVATISGNTVTIVGAGTSTITATQAATSSYNSGSITATLTVTVPPLTTPAATPPARNSWDVVSLYSDSYTNKPIVWQGIATNATEQLQGNDTKKLSNFNIEIINIGPSVDVSAMTHLHMDVYSTDCNGIRTYLISNGDRGATSTVTLNQWNSIDIPLSNFATGGFLMNAISGLKLESMNGSGKTIYIDNIYFYRPATLQPPTLTNFTIPAKAVGDPAFTLTAPTSDSAGAFTYTSSNQNVATVSGNTVTIVGGGTTTITATQAADGTFSSGTITAQLAVAYAPPVASPVPPARTPDRVVSMYTGTPAVYPTTINAVRASWTGGTTMTSIPNGTNTCLKLDNFGYLGLVNQGDAHFSVEGMTNLHLDVYVNEPLSRLFVFLLSNGDQLYQTSTLSAGWNSLNIDLSQFPNANLADVAGLKLEQNVTGATQIYIDNVYFSNDCYTYYTDNDGDGYGDDNTGFFVCQLIPGLVTVGGDCDDNNANVNPGVTEICYNGIDDDCDTLLSEGCAPVLTHIMPTFCGSTLAKAKSTITASNATYSGPFAVSYLFRITNLTTNAVVELPRAFRNFNLGMTDIIAYGTSYSVEVAAVISGEQQPFSTPCIITTPSIPTTKLVQCGGTITSMTSSVACNSVAYALGYQFEIAQTSNPTAVKEVFRLYNNFSMALANSAPDALPLLYNTEYRVRVKAKVLIDGDEVWGNYGDPCIIRTPAAPDVYMTACSEQGIRPANLNAQVYSNNVSYATMYKFTIYNDSGYSQSVERAFNSFRLSDFNALAPLTPGATYSIVVDVKLYDHYYAGKDCEIVIPGGNNADGNAGGGTIVKTQIDGEFKATAYPNPFANNFLINVNTKSDSALNIKVYDMLGRLVDQKSVKTSSLETSPIGDDYPSGVYNVVITQNEETRTLRVVKR